MGLSNWQVATTTFRVSGTEIVVRGLCFDDVAYLLQRHQKELDAMIGRVEEASSDGEVPADKAQDLVGVLISQAPQLAASIIACAANEPEAQAQARRLPLPTQVDILIEVGRLTFEEAGGVKKFLDNVLLIARSTQKTLSDLRPPDLQPVARKTGNTGASG